MSSVISVAPCEIVSLKLKFDSFVKMRVAQGILAAWTRICAEYADIFGTPARKRGG
jgi:hypothetical protein